MQPKKIKDWLTPTHLSGLRIPFSRKSSLISPRLGGEPHPASHRSLPSSIPAWPTLAHHGLKPWLGPYWPVSPGKAEPGPLHPRCRHSATEQWALVSICGRTNEWWNERRNLRLRPSAFILTVMRSHEKVLRKGEVRETHCGEEGMGSPRAGLGHLVAPDERLILPPKSLDPLVQLSILLLLRFQIQCGRLRGRAGKRLKTFTRPRVRESGTSSPKPSAPRLRSQRPYFSSHHSTGRVGPGSQQTSPAESGHSTGGS